MVKVAAVGIFAFLLLAMLAATIPPEWVEALTENAPHSQDFATSASANWRGVYVDDEELDGAIVEMVAASENAFAMEAVNLWRSSMFHGVGTSYSHAESKHPGVTECRQGGDVMSVWENPDTGHCAEIIQSDDETFVVRIVKQIDGLWEEITALVDDAYEYAGVEEYMIRGGYMEIWHP